MKIVWRTVREGGKDVTVAFIDTEGLEISGYDTIQLLPEPQEDDDISTDTEVDPYSDETTSVVNHPVTDTDGPFDLNKLYFRVDSFQKLLTNPTAVWDPLMVAANRFFTILSDDDLRHFCRFFIDARRTIDRDLLPGSVTSVVTYLGNMFYDLAVAIDLPNKIMDYVKHTAEIPIPDLSSAGTNASRDTEELTFCARGDTTEYYMLLAIVVVCKILFPICGDMIKNTKGDVDNMLKEAHCIKILEPVLSLDVFHHIYHKLFNYVSHAVDTEMKNNYSTAAFTASIGGVTKLSFHTIVFSHLLIKRFVTVDPYKDKGNIMVWVASCAKNAFRSLQTSLNRHCKIMPRTDVSDTDYEDGERSVSVLEHGSRITEVTADVPRLIIFGVRMAIPRLMDLYEVSEMEFSQTLAYYRTHPIQVTMFNKILIGLFVGHAIGGAKGLNYIDRALYTELIVVVQCHIASKYAAQAVVHLLTANTPDEEKPVLEFSAVNTTIQQTAKQTREYKSCEETFPVINGVGIGTVLKAMQDFIVKYHHFANTAPFVSAMMEQDALPQGTLVTYERDVMQNTCEIILGQLDPDKTCLVKRR